jgi:hypothetical protein
MSKKIAGRTFSTPEDAGVSPPTEAELARARNHLTNFSERWMPSLQKIASRKSRQNFGMTFQALRTTSTEPAET